ncbi:hypothetical protein, partial [Streptomyces beihaiensis]
MSVDGRDEQGPEESGENTDGRAQQVPSQGGPQRLPDEPGAPTSTPTGAAGSGSAASADMADVSVPAQREA